MIPGTCEYPINERYYMLIKNNKLEKYQSLLFQMYLLCLSFFIQDIFWYSHYTCHTFVVVPYSLDILCWFLFFSLYSLCFQFLEVLLIYSLTQILPSAMTNLMCPSQALSLPLQYFIFSIYFWLFLRVFISLLTLPTYYCTCLLYLLVFPAY